MRPVHTSGTVSIRAEQDGPNVNFEASDKFGFTRSGTVPDAPLEAICWQPVADLHRKISQFRTGRN